MIPDPVNVVLVPFVPLTPPFGGAPIPFAPIETVYTVEGDKVNNPALYCLALKAILDNDGSFVCKPPAPPPAPTLVPPPPPPPTAKYITPLITVVGVIVVLAVQT